MKSMFLVVFLQFALSVICMGIYLKGYFPVSQNEYTIVEPPKKVDNIDLDTAELYKPTLTRLVLMVIDGLREDFVTADNMPYTYAEKSCVLPVKVEAPTVTLPRIKAVTTGSVPQFIDVVLNLGATAKCNDSFLHRAQAAGKKMVFFGDDTWLKIFPDVFVRSDGTTSFYVTDFTEVDDNVTRHLDDELKKDDWDIMFLHYLGLDHIGHVRGPNSSLIKTKLAEMDDIIKTLNEARKTWNQNSAIFVTGDHGMKNSGGHGGTTYAEVMVPLVALGIPCGGQTDTIFQTDIATTLSLLFALEIPANSVGKMIPNLLEGKDLKELLYLAYYNLLALQVHENSCQNFRANYSEVLKSKSNITAKSVLKYYQDCLGKTSRKLVQSSVEQNSHYLLFALVMSVNSLLLIIVGYYESKKELLLLTYVITALYFITSKLGTFIPFTLLSLFLLFVLLKTTFRVFGGESEVRIYVLPLVLHSVLLQSSSFVEEEHQIWYFYTATIVVAIFYSNLQNYAILLVIVGLRFLRRLNSTGDQWASYPDLADWFLVDENFTYLCLFYAVSLVAVLVGLFQLTNSVLQRLLYAVTLASIFVFKMFYVNIVVLGKAAWGLIILTSLSELLHKQSVQHKLTITWILVILLLLRPYNAVLTAACIFWSNLSLKFVKNIEPLTAMHICFGYTLFFCQGHSNSLASVDLAPSYIGLGSYIPSLVFTFTICHTYAFPILSLLLLLRKYPPYTDAIFTITIIARLWVLTVIYVLSYVQRNHLFVWSVFAPKLLIESIHTLVLFMFTFVYYTITTAAKKIANKGYFYD